MRSKLRREPEKELFISGRDFSNPIQEGWNTATIQDISYEPKYETKAGTTALYIFILDIKGIKIKHQIFANYTCLQQMEDLIEAATGNRCNLNSGAGISTKKLIGRKIEVKLERFEKLWKIIDVSPIRDIWR